MNQHEIKDLQARLRARALNINEQPSTTQASETTCMYGYRLDETCRAEGCTAAHEPPAPRAGERTCERLSEHDADSCGECREIRHAALVAQRERLLETMRQIRTAATNVASYDRALADIRKLTKDAITTIEQDAGNASEEGRG